MQITTIIIAFLGVVALILFTSTQKSKAIEGTLDTKSETIMSDKPDGYPIATLAGGCFWCLESELRALDGVLFTRVGYTGGESSNPSYQHISSGETGHAEAVEITYDPDKLSYEKIIAFFLTKAHDPTQLNRQGVDVGTQYRSAIFYHDEGQEEIAARLIDKVNAQKLYKNKIVTELAPAQAFWLGEDYHQQYYEKYEEKNGEIHPRVFFKKKAKLLKQ